MTTTSRSPRSACACLVSTALRRSPRRTLSWTCQPPALLVRASSNARGRGQVHIITQPRPNRRAFSDGNAASETPAEAQPGTAVLRTAQCIRELLVQVDHRARAPQRGAPTRRDHTRVAWIEVALRRHRPVSCCARMMGRHERLAARQAARARQDVRHLVQRGHIDGRPGPSTRLRMDLIGEPPVDRSGIVTA